MRVRKHATGMYRICEKIRNTFRILVGKPVSAAQYGRHGYIIEICLRTVRCESVNLFDIYHKINSVAMCWGHGRKFGIALRICLLAK